MKIGFIHVTRLIAVSWAVIQPAGALKLAGQSVAGAKNRDEACPSMFVAVFSREDGAKTRSMLRDMWVGEDTFFERQNSDDFSDADLKSAANGWSNLVANFAICTDEGQTPAALQKEADDYGDLLFMDCKEGYGHGLLTKKTLAAMQAFRQRSNAEELFMKVDDDTFVARRRLCHEILARTDANSLGMAYMGVLTPKRSDEAAVPHREKSSQFYEPEDVYPNKTYPWSMEGGPGYILGRNLLNTLLDDDIPAAHMLWTEDKAVGVWVYEAEQRGSAANWVDIPGTDGYSLWKDRGKWGDYPYVLRHHLRPQNIQCMSRIAVADKADATVDNCFSD